MPTSKGAKLRKSNGRSKITNGTILIPRNRSKVPPSHVDGRSMHMRRFRDVFAIHIADLGGEDAISEAEKSIVRRAATLTVLLERMELTFALEEGDSSAFKIDQYQRVAGSLRRLLESVGLKRRQRDVTPSLSDYLRQKAAEREARTDDDDDDVAAPRVINGSAHATQRVRARP